MTLATLNALEAGYNYQRHRVNTLRHGLREIATFTQGQAIGSREHSIHMLATELLAASGDH